MKGKDVNFTNACDKLGIDHGSSVSNRLNELFILYKHEVISAFNSVRSNLLLMYTGDALTQKLAEFDLEITIDNIDIRDPFLNFRGLPESVIDAVWKDLTLGETIEQKNTMDKVEKPIRKKSKKKPTNFDHYKVIDILVEIRKVDKIGKLAQAIGAANANVLRKRLIELITIYQLSYSTSDYLEVLSNLTDRKAQQLFGERTLMQALQMDASEVSSILSNASQQPAELNPELNFTDSTIDDFVNLNQGYEELFSAVQQDDDLPSVNMPIPSDYINDNVFLEQQEAPDAELSPLPVTLPTPRLASQGFYSPSAKRPHHLVENDPIYESNERYMQANKR